MADTVFIDLHHGAGIGIFHCKRQCIVDVLFFNGVPPHGELYQVLHNIFGFGNIGGISDDLERSVSQDHGHIQGTFNFLYMLVKLTEYILLVLCRNFCNRFNDAHESVFVLSTRFPVF